MLEKNSDHRLTVNKGKARAFLVFCVELANANQEHYEGVFLASLNRGDFKTDLTKPEDAFSFYKSRIPGLVENIHTLASCVSREKEFTVEASKTSGVWVTAGAIRTGIGSPGYIEYYKKSGASGRKKVLKKILRNDLIDAFFETLPSVLYQPTEGDPKMIPIRQCPECKKPFLARRWDQAFCSLQHSQKWRSREKYRKTQEG